MTTVSVRAANDQDFTIDSEDAERVNQYEWRVYSFGRENQYVVSTQVPGARTTYLHRFLMNVTYEKVEVDHVDGNGLNNTKTNLRFASHKQNLANQRAQAGRRSHYRGVYYYESSYERGHRLRTKPWYAKIKVDGKQRTLGYYETEIEAAAAYNAAAASAWGEHARLNNLLAVV